MRSLYMASLTFRWVEVLKRRVSERNLVRLEQQLSQLSLHQILLEGFPLSEFLISGRSRGKPEGTHF